MFYFDPLEQFSIEVYNAYVFGIQTIPCTTLGKMAFFNFVLMVLLIYECKHIIIFTKIQAFVMALFIFILSIVKDAINVKKHSFILMLYCIFLFIFISNIIGMIPYSITITSHLIIALFFSLAFFIGNNIVGFIYHQEKYYVLFLPEGVPVFIIPFLILIEYVSYLSRIFSLAIRLFANMMSGHILLKILISFIWTIVTVDVIH